jgi:hypothetical protein
MRSRGIAGIVGLCIGLVCPAAASAAEVIGQTGTPAGCAQDNAYTQRQLASGASYSPSEYGVITSWSAQADATANRTMKLLVLRPTLGPAPHTFAAVQKDELRTLAVASELNTFTGMSLPIAPGERLGLHVPSGQPLASSSACFSSGMAFDVLTSNNPPGEPPLGVSESYSSMDAGLRLNASAVVEPDADRDGFGDETQDCDPGDASKHDDCTAPETTITKGPKAKTKKKQATFEFTSNEQGSTFECAVDGQALKAPCTSPHTIKVKRGRHEFEVRATDQAGNADGSPATDSWKVKKKR